MTDEADKDDISLSTSDIFKKNQAEEAREDRLSKAKSETEPASQTVTDSNAQETRSASASRDNRNVSEKDLTQDMTKLIRHKGRRQEIEHWDNLFFDLKRIDAMGQERFSKKLHREILRLFGYRDKYLSRPKPLKNPPLRAGVVAFIFEDMGWEKGRVSRKTFRQRQWIEVRAGLREPNIKPRKRQKSNGCVIWAIIFIVLILMFT